MGVRAFILISSIVLHTQIMDWKTALPILFVITSGCLFGEPRKLEGRYKIKQHVTGMPSSLTFYGNQSLLINQTNGTKTSGFGENRTYTIYLGGEFTVPYEARGSYFVYKLDSDDWIPACRIRSGGKTLSCPDESGGEHEYVKL